MGRTRPTWRFWRRPVSPQPNLQTKLRYHSFELARVLVRSNYVASVIVNANHSVVRTAARLRVADCISDRVTGPDTTADRNAALRRSDQRRAYLCGAGLRKCAFYSGRASLTVIWRPLTAAPSRASITETADSADSISTKAAPRERQVLVDDDVD